MTPADHIYRFLDYTMLGKEAAGRMKVSRALDSGWHDWREWFASNSDLQQDSESQVGQDLYLAFMLEKLFAIDARTHRGRFVEFGAADGILHSNTLLLERLGWTGMLAEPDPVYFESCCQNRTSPALEVCVVGNDCHAETISFSSVVNNRALSSVAGFGKAVAQTLEIHEHDVPVLPLDALLARTGYVDVLSIDTEGTEPDLVENSVFEVRPRVLVIEHNNNPAGRSRIQRALEARDFVRFPRRGDFFDDYYYDGRRPLAGSR